MKSFYTFSWGSFFDIHVKLPQFIFVSLWNQLKTFLEPTSTKQWNNLSLWWVQTNKWPLRSQTRYLLCHASLTWSMSISFWIILMTYSIRIWNIQFDDILVNCGLFINGHSVDLWVKYGTVQVSQYSDENFSSGG